MDDIFCNKLCLHGIQWYHCSRYQNTVQRKKEGGVVDNTKDSKEKCLRNVEKTGL